MEFVKRHRWFLIGLASLSLVAWWRLFILGQPLLNTSWLFPLFISWLCTPRHQFWTGSWLVWFAIWWMALGFWMSRDYNPLESRLTWLFPLLLMVTAARIMKVLSADAKLSKNQSHGEGKLG
jgi:hypothetical protein